MLGTGFEGGEEVSTQHTRGWGLHCAECGPRMFLLCSDLPGSRKGEEQGEDPISPHCV